MLVLREFNSSDRNQIVAILNSPNVTSFLSSRIPSPYSFDDADWWLEIGCKQGIIKAIEINNLFAGCIGVESGQYEYTFTGEVGYWFAQEFWGKGYATEALKRFIELLPLGAFHRIQATVFEDNTASCKVLEKCGFKQEANLEKALCKNGCFYNAIIYGKLFL